MNLDQALQTFVGESRDLLEEMERALLTIHEADDRGECIHAIFRAAHTIKGSAGLFGLDHVVAFTHVAESVLDRVRDGRVALSEALVALLLSARDHMGAQIDAVAHGRVDPDVATEAAGAALAARLGEYLGSPPPSIAAPDASPGAASGGLWHISLRFHADTLRHGMDPLSFLQYLARLGQIVGIATLADSMPPAAEMDAEACYLGFEVALRAETARAAIEAENEYLRDDCDMRNVAPGSPAEVFEALMADLPEGAGRLRPLLAACGSLPKSDPEPRSEGRVETAPARPGSMPRKENASIRVDAHRLDQLIDQIGELIIASAGVSLLARETRHPELQERTTTLDALVQTVRESALQLRMVRIGATFNRFQRVVHDTARELGKDIALVVHGEDTELDKTVVEKIADPITHLVRNAIDHGIEPAGQRLARGKPARGTLRLNAWHDSGAIVIEVGDDGGGLDRDKILAKGIERGLVEPGRELADDEVYALIFEPGFSTATAVTSLSGRGVGMDVVKRNITALRGSIAIASRPGDGTTMSIRLPLTLAIIDGFLVSVGSSAFVIPLDAIEECVEFGAAEEGDYLDLRGQVLPFIQLSEALGVDATPGRHRSVVVIRHAGRRAGLVVDALLGEFQTVIKPLGRLFEGLRCVSGSTVLGSGRVALILDVAALMQRSAALALVSAASDRRVGAFSTCSN